MKNLKISVIFTLVLFIIGSTLIPVFSNEGSVPLGVGYLVGIPTFQTGSAIAYYIWRTEDIIHIRWTSNDNDHIFSGTITANTALTNVVKIGMEKGDHTFKTSKKEIVYRATTSTKMDGFDFQMNNPSSIKASLFVDGNLIDASSIYMGKGNSTPDGNPIVFYKP